MPSDTMTGGCLCGAVRYTASGVETHVHACHCGMCRRWSGGPAISTQAERIAFEGEDAIRTYASSEWAERGFCGECGTNLFYRMKPTAMTFLWLGTFDDPSPFELVGEIYIDDKPALYDLAGDHLRQTGEEFLASIGATIGLPAD